MRTTTATVLLTVMFLSAGAFADVSQPPAPQPHPAFTYANHTIIEKNQSWPTLIESPIRACRDVRCIDV